MHRIKIKLFFIQNVKKIEFLPEFVISTKKECKKKRYGDCLRAGGADQNFLYNGGHLYNVIGFS